MIDFDISKIEIKNVYLKYITRSMGGTMTILDTSNTKAGEKFVRVSTPMHVVDSFMNQHMSKYIKPLLTSVCYYDGIIVALQPHPLGNLGQETVETLFGIRPWESNIHKNVHGTLKQQTSYRRWFIDGAVVYNFDDKKLKNLSKDGKFQALEVTAFRLTDLSNRVIDTTQRTCIAFTATTGQNIISPPVWRDLNTIGKSKMDKGENINEAPLLNMDENHFDKVDRVLAVNLNFALHAGKVLIESFGYDAIEPLRLDDLMVNLKTVNLSKIDKSIKNTHDIGLKFTHAMAWLIGLGAREQTLESMTALRGMLRYLTGRGIVHKTALAKDNVFHKNMDISAVPLMTIDELTKALEDAVAADTLIGWGAFTSNQSFSIPDDTIIAEVA